LYDACATAKADVMDYRKLGPSGPQVSLLGLGCNQLGGRLDFAASETVVNKALDLGVSFFDTADSYGADGGSETFLGRILGARRKDVIVATKFGMSGGASRAAVARAAEASLKRLGTDWIDLYQLHRPDAATPIAETLEAMHKLVQQGKVRQIGCSYFTAAQLRESEREAARGGFTPFTTCQNEYSLLVRGIERELVPAMAEKGVGFIPYLPIAGGLLTGKYKRDATMPEGARLTTMRWLSDRYLNERNWRIVARLTEFGAARGRSLLELAMGWLAAHPFVSTIIAGATQGAQVEANLAALSWRPTPDEMAELDRLSAEAG
jgi:aryl-alcohol dehydrogenase-like predicted oxidoreductase